MNKWHFAIIALCIVCAHCTRFDEYKKYAPDGEIIYPQKPDSLKTYPGKNRIQLEWVIADPKVTSCQIVYEQGGIRGDTTVLIQDGDDGNDTIRVIIPHLEETNYRFKIISCDDFGHTSVTVETEEQAYGEIYERSLFNRELKNKEYNPVEGLTMEWYQANDGEIGVKLEYTDKNGMPQTIIMDATGTVINIPDFNIDEPLMYSSMYKPVPSAIDTFYTQKVVERFE